MRFFSNEAAKEDQQHDATDDPDATMAVPQQRSGSPWSNGPHDEADDPDRTTAFEAESTPRGDAGEVAHEDLEGGHDTFRADHEDAPAPAHDEVDLPLDEDDEVEGRPRATTTTYGPDGTVVDDTETDTVPAEDAAVKDEGEFDSPEAVDPATDEPLETGAHRATDVDTEPETDTDTAEVDAEPVAAPADTTPVDTAPIDTTPVEDTPVESAPVEAAPVAATPVAPATPAAGTTDRFFADGDSYKERFRDVALSFVDDPKDATDQAATLVSEAIDKLTSALQSQRDELDGEGDDTEALRVRLRGYRDILNRITAL